MKHVPHSPTPSASPLPASLSRTLFLLSLGLAATTNAAPIPVTGTGSYTQNFDALASSGTMNPWVDDSTIAGWYSQRTGSGTIYIANAGPSNSGGLYSYGADSTAERALGTVGSSNAVTGHFAHGLLLENTSGSTVTINTLAYTGEQWRNGGVTVPQTVTLWHKISPSVDTEFTPNDNTNWTALTAGDFSGPINTGSAGALDGNNAANRTPIVINPNINVPNGNFVMIRWSDPDHTGSDHGLAIDDVSLAWVTNSSPLLAVSAPLDIFSEGAGPNASMGTVTIPATLGTDLVVSLVSSDTTEATVPASVTIPAGQTSANFNISAVNDLLADGSQSVMISATADGYLAGHKGLSVEDDFDAPISVSVTPSSFLENAGPEAATGTLTIAENTLVDLAVNLISTDITEATVPASVTIPVGKNTVDFKVAAQDDPDLDGTRTLSIQASATGYTGGSFLIQVEDFGDTAPAPTLPVNAIAFTGYNADGNDNLAFVALVPIAAGDVILFSDNEWNGSAIGSGGGFVDTNEGVLTWTAPAAGVAVGTIVALDNLDQNTRTTSVGTLTGSNFALAAAGDTVFAFQGALLSPQRVIAAISANTDIITGTGLTEHVVLATGTDIGAYKGSRGNQATFEGYLTQIHNVAANWVTQDSGANDGIDMVDPNVPFSSTPFKLGTGDNFSSWIAGFQVGSLTGPNDDFDNDELDNMVENILGSDPSVGNAGLNTVSGTANSVTFQHNLADSPATDLTAVYEWSADLAAWYPSGAGGGVAVTIGAPVVITNGTPNDLVEVTATVTSGSTTKLFVRLKVSQ